MRQIQGNPSALSLGWIPNRIAHGLRLRPEMELNS